VSLRNGCRRSGKFPDQLSLQPQKARGCRVTRRSAEGHGDRAKPGWLAADHVNRMTEPECFERVVSHEQGSALGQELGRELLQAISGYGIERREWLIHQHDGPIFHQRTGEGDALAHAARKLSRPRIPLTCETDHR
jgi:hypothetical protein